MKYRNRPEEDFKWYFNRFVETLSGNEPGYSETFYRKVFFGVFEDVKRHLDDVVHGMRYDIQDNLNRYSEEIANEIANEFCKYHWEKFQDGHDWYEGMKAICYFKEVDKYFVGTAKRHGNGDTNFLLENGQYADPDFVCPLYEYIEKDEGK